jgi:hypothetical protein
MVFLNDGEFDPYDDVILISEKWIILPISVLKLEIS